MFLTFEEGRRVVFTCQWAHCSVVYWIPRWRAVVTWPVVCKLHSHATARQLSPQGCHPRKPISCHHMTSFSRFTNFGCNFSFIKCFRSCGRNAVIVIGL